MLSNLFRGLFSSSFLVTSLRNTPVIQASFIPPMAVTLTRGIKTRSSIKKRFRVKHNRVVRLQCSHRHLSYGKTRRHVNRLGFNVAIGPAFSRRYLRAMGASPLR